VREACRHADISAKGILLEIAKARTIPAMLRLIEEIQAHQLDRDAIRDRRRQLAHASDHPADEPEASPPAARPRPYTVRFRSPDRVVSLSLSFRTIEQPKRAEVIRALETILDELRSGPETEIDP
jgi:hypothetical protein